MTAAPPDGATVPTDPLGAFVVGPRLVAAGRGAGPLDGARFAVKDLIDVAGLRTGAGNPDWLADAPVAPDHAAVVDALLADGADLWGKTVTDELAFSLSGTNVHYGTPRNPAAPGRVPGGSSSGSAAAVAGGAVELALGTDTGGSVRVPASYCGILGLRPTHGRLDGRGVFLLAPSFCTPGLFARDGATLALGWHALARHAGTVPPRPARTVSALVAPPELFALADDAARPPLLDAARRLAELLELPLVERPLASDPDPDAIRDAFRTIQTAEAWGLHGPWIDSRTPDLGPGVSSRFRAGSEVEPEAIVAARELLAAWRSRLGLELGGALWIQPAASGPAPPVHLDAGVKDDLRRRTLTLTAPAGLGGCPALSLPLASVDRLPVGLALCGLPGDDELLVAAAGQLPQGGA